MPQFSGFLDLMGARSFSSVWYWLFLVGAWTLAGRAVLGVPADVLARARRDTGGQGGLMLLDWLSLTLPRWGIERRVALVLVAAGGFVLTALALLGFLYGLELAQALALMLAPFALILALRLRLARRLGVLMRDAQAGAMAPADAASAALHRIARHQRVVAALSILTIAATAVWGTLYGLIHPYGL